MTRKVDYHPLSIQVPYYHSNVDSDEIMFYVDGDYEARKGSGVDPDVLIDIGSRLSAPVTLPWQSFEEMIGAWLPSRREHIILATKVGRPTGRPGWRASNTPGPALAGCWRRCASCELPRTGSVPLTSRKGCPSGATTTSPL